MNDRTLDQATERWVEADLIDEETAEAIRMHEQDREDDSSRRFSTILAGMGAALIGAGVLVYLGANWDILPTWLRTALLVVIPVGFAVAGVVLDRRRIPRAGLGMWILATLAVGPSVFLLVDLHAPTLDVTWPLLAWGILAVPMGHAFRTRLGTGVGLIALLAASVTIGAGDNGLLLAGFVATMFLGAVLLLRRYAENLVHTYQVVGCATVIVIYLWLATMEGQFDILDIEFDPGVMVGIVLAGLVVAGAVAQWQQGSARREDALFVLIPPVAMLFVIILALGFDGISWFIGYFAGQAVLLGILLAIVVLSLSLGSTVLVNVAVIGFFFQIFTLLLTITDELSGALALVVTGTILVLAAVGLERGRRRLLDRLNRS